MRLRRLIFLLIGFFVVATVLATKEGVQTERVCRVCITDYKKVHLGVETTIERIDCVELDGNQETIQLHFDSDGDFVAAHGEAIGKEALFVAFRPELVMNGSIGKNHQNDIRLLSNEELAPPNRRARVEINSRRRNLSGLGGQRVAAIVIHTADVKNLATIQSIDRVLFTEVNGQYINCSNNAMWLVQSHSTLSVELPGRASTYTHMSIASAGRRAVCLELNLTESCDPVGELQLDNILYIAPFGLSDDMVGVHWAYASTGDGRKLSVYTQEYFVPSTIMHEMAHNYMLGHAMEGSSLYGDHTGQMGGGWGTERCFNGFNLHVLGWFEDETLELTLLESNSASLYYLKSVVDSGTGGNVNIKIGSYYMTYNMAKGFNSQTEEYLDSVLIHEGIDISFGSATPLAYSHTNLTAHLSAAGDRFSSPYGGDILIVELCSIDKVGTHGAKLSIGLGVGCEFSDIRTGDLVIQKDPTSSPTTTPSPTVTNAPTVTVPVPLKNGEWRYVSGDQNSIRNFRLRVPSSATFVTCSIQGGTGEADLLANWFEPPSLFAFGSDSNDCYPYKFGNDENCHMTPPSSQTELSLFVSVHAYRQMSNVGLRCTIEFAPFARMTLAPTVSPRSSSPPSESKYPTKNPSLSNSPPEISTSTPSWDSSGKPTAAMPSGYPSLSGQPSLKPAATSGNLSQHTSSFLPTTSPSPVPLRDQTVPIPWTPHGENDFPNQPPSDKDAASSSVSSSSSSSTIFLFTACVGFILVSGFVAVYVLQNKAWKKATTLNGQACESKLEKADP